MLSPQTTVAHRRSTVAVQTSIATVANTGIAGVFDITAAHLRDVQKTIAGARPHARGEAGENNRNRRDGSRRCATVDACREAHAHGQYCGDASLCCRSTVQVSEHRLDAVEPLVQFNQARLESRQFRQYEFAQRSPHIQAVGEQSSCPDAVFHGPLCEIIAPIEKFLVDQVLVDAFSGRLHPFLGRLAGRVARYCRAIPVREGDIVHWSSLGFASHCVCSQGFRYFSPHCRRRRPREQPRYQAEFVLCVRTSFKGAET